MAGGGGVRLAAPWSELWGEPAGAPVERGLPPAGDLPEPVGRGPGNVFCAGCPGGSHPACCRHPHRAPLEYDPYPPLPTVRQRLTMSLRRFLHACHRDAA